ncbi:MAG: D-sedoheptulose 7-phosphate isomerase [Leptospiraceae bacterium]|jgi:D-sedoheptulose 7-phosphate isomerase|nr:D-sedoheptulose 7-phosphate isomerase [Leptospiraceae bacterium]
MSLDLIKSQINESILTKQELLNQCLDEIEKSGQILVEALNSNHKILLCGNGGSAADAQHIAAELIIRYKSSNERRSLPAISLATDTSVLTACGNDYGYDYVFSRQIEGLGNEGDVLIAISTSGNSPNIVNAIRTAYEKKLKIIALTGANGGKIQKELSNIVDVIIKVPSNITARIQECHILLGHIFCEYIEKYMFKF